MTENGTPDGPQTDPGNTTPPTQPPHKNDDLKPVPPSDVVNLGSYILDEIAVMTEHALDVGVSIPEGVAQNLQTVQEQIEQQQKPSFELLISIHNALSV